MYAIVDRDTRKFYWRTDKRYNPPRHIYRRKETTLFNTHEEAVSVIRDEELENAEPIKVHFERIVDYTSRYI